jgi:hypothetical protein
VTVRRATTAFAVFVLIGLLLFGRELYYINPVGVFLLLTPWFIVGFLITLFVHLVLGIVEPPKLVVVASISSLGAIVIFDTITCPPGCYSFGLWPVISFVMLCWLGAIMGTCTAAFLAWRFRER